MWFWLSILAMILWSGSDVFSKVGCRDKKDTHSYLKMLTAVGIVMGLHALTEILSGTKISLQILLTYLPVSAMYILSMAIGYVALKYIELSISSPICNSSGAIVAIIVLTVNGGGINPTQYIGIAAVVMGIVALGFIESFEDKELRALRQEKSNYKYAKSTLAIILPLIYCLLDALGTYADSVVLTKIDEDSANVAYELTFFTVGAVSFIYTKFIKKDRYIKKYELSKYAGAVCETAGQFAYIYALGDEDHVMFSAPIISAYCALSVVWSRIFLKERLNYKHYLSILVTVAGIVILGIFDG